MTCAKKHAQRRSAAPFAATLAALLLAGCSSGHVGESWQCPLAKGGSCGSVAAADPAVPDRQVAGSTVLKEPLYRARTGRRSKAPAPCAADCGGGFDPFGWLTRLFGANAGSDEARPQEIAPGSANAPEAPAAASSSALAKKKFRTGEAADGAAPEAAESNGGHRREDDLRGDGLRTGEVVARIWIAPFVDANGVYREAAHVRAVLEPAGWRLK